MQTKLFVDHKLAIVESEANKWMKDKNIEIIKMEQSILTITYPPNTPYTDPYELRHALTILYQDAKKS